MDSNHLKFQSNPIYHSHQLLIVTNLNDSSQKLMIDYHSCMLYNFYETLILKGICK